MAFVSDMVTSVPNLEAKMPGKDWQDRVKGLLKAELKRADVTYEVLHASHGLTGEDLKLASEWLASRP